jgi:hypothetical protein
VFVEEYAGVRYARFAVAEPVTIEIEVEAPIATWTAFPEGRAVSPRVVGNILEVELATPDAVVVWVDGLEKLFLLPDPMEYDAPTPGSADVFNVISFGADATGRSIATSARSRLPRSGGRPATGRGTHSSVRLNQAPVPR